MTKHKNAILALLIGFSTLAVNQAWAERGGGNGRKLDRPSGGQYRERYQDLRQERKSFQQEFQGEVQERARDRGVGREGVRPGEMEGRREPLMMPEERERYQDQYRELREERKGLRGLTEDAGAGRGGRGMRQRQE
ncbi:MULTISPECIES: hypothetical protein [Methylocaldum]|jgi:hypothetical protein|uniref:hypothetical protein n=1 Tax=unclassified Methylocaldum TaxID=2622260 RepID=UPI00098BAC77|nr:hypothetical protein [Methylocaldum sp. 14B]